MVNKRKILETNVFGWNAEHGFSLEEMKEKIKEWEKKYSKEYEALQVAIDLDWGGCYYEGDSPDIECDLIGFKK